MDRLIFSSASELAAMIRRHQVSAAEVVDAYLVQIELHNATLNAIVTLDEAGARSRAREADEALARGELWGPLHGVPITIKDALATAGLRTTSGFPPLAGFVPSTDATVVGRLRAAGAVILGKTNLPPLSGDHQTDNPIFGRTNNPWDLARTPGGSGGGGSAALAAGLTPLDIGGDMGGSVRIPAHYCGVFALKPSEHRVPGTGYHPGPEPKIPWATRQQMAVIGPMARSVEDLVLALSLIAGPDGQQVEIPPVPLEKWSARSLSDLRLAWTDDFGGVPVTRDTRNALTGLAAELQPHASRIERCLPDGFDFTVAWETMGEMYLAGLGSIVPPEAQRAVLASFGADSAEDVPLVRGMARALDMTMRQCAEMLARRDTLIRAAEQFFAEWDALLCPVSATPAFLHCPPLTPVAVDDQSVPYWMIGAYTCPFNLTGHPAVVLPLALSSDGLPIGLQIVGRRWGDMGLLAIAKCIAEVVGPFRPPPGY